MHRIPKVSLVNELNAISDKNIDHAIHKAFVIVRLCLNPYLDRFERKVQQQSYVLADKTRSEVEHSCVLVFIIEVLVSPFLEQRVRVKVATSVENTSIVSYTRPAHQSVCAFLLESSV